MQSEGQKSSTEPTPTEAKKPKADESTHQQRDPNKVYLTVNVPAEAKVFVNEKPTTTIGTMRTYVSSGTRDGKQYKYEIRAEVDRNGTNQVESQVVYAGAGDHPTVTFDLEPVSATERVADETLPKTAPPKTTLKLKVPSDAKVTLAGNDTESTGSNRVFQTTALGQGQHWNDYTVRAEVQRGGKTLVREKKITLQAGELRELTIHFPATKVAAVATNQ